MNNELLKISSRMMVDLVGCLSVKYDFDLDEALRFVNMEVGVVDRVVKEKVVKEKVVKDKVVKEVVSKCSFPLPFDGKEEVMNCSALKKCEGLYTQCVQKKSVDSNWCKGCASQIAKNDDKPLYGSIQDRLAVDIMEYVDPKGVKVTAFKKVIKKLKISDSEIESECARLGVTILDIHMKEEDDSEKKKGRPKKVSKVLEIEGESSDLFAELVANADPEVECSEESSSESSEKSSRIEMGAEDKQSKQVEKETAKVEKAAKVAAEKASKAAKLEEDKAAKAAKAAAEKVEKAAKLEEEKAAKAAKAAAEKEEKAAKAAKLEEEKAAKAAKLEEEKAAKAAKLEEEKAAKAAKLEEEKAAKAAKLEEAKVAKAAEKPSAKAAEKPSAKAVEKQTAKAAEKPSAKAVEKAVEKKKEDEPDVVKRFEFEGKKYLKSRNTGVIYNMEQDVVGVWNEKLQKIEFKEIDSEEEEDEYDEDDV
jgi:hypothetical protein